MLFRVPVEIMLDAGSKLKPKHNLSLVNMRVRARFQTRHARPRGSELRLIEEPGIIRIQLIGSVAESATFEQEK
ncbi:hypothetical protein AOC05_12815 [Arthrobacter alpinus]|uniref:Uncharacterized protein n=1 Tax=Arthrobacter alpinus TaxID=656366 RepID=A0A0M4QQZ1_9MICC|nr:hypothetical protein AOC05_12815 [Arthrobacter alpinus]